MKFKTAAYRSAVIITILALAVGIGYVYSKIGHAFDLREHPRDFEEIVGEYSAAYGVPEYIIYGTIKESSDFRSNFVSADGRIGLMQLSDDTFYRLTRITKEDLESGMLYDPETNIRYGTYHLSRLYTEYGRWNTVFAILVTDDEELVRSWLVTDDQSDSRGSLRSIPDSDVEERVARLEAAAKMYKELYYGG